MAPDLRPMVSEMFAYCFLQDLPFFLVRANSWQSTNKWLVYFSFQRKVKLHFCFRGESGKIHLKETKKIPKFTWRPRWGSQDQTQISYTLNPLFLISALLFLWEIYICKYVYFLKCQWHTEKQIKFREKLGFRRVLKKDLGHSTWNCIQRSWKDDVDPDNFKEEDSKGRTAASNRWKLSGDKINQFYKSVLGRQ